MSAISWLAEQIVFHAGSLWVDAEFAVAEFAQNRRRTLIPAGPGERRVAVHVLGVKSGAGVEKALDGFFIGEGGGAVQRSFSPGAAVSHEAAGGFGWQCLTVG